MKNLVAANTKNKDIPYDAGDADDGIDRLPAYAEANPNAQNEIRQMEEKVNRDPMLLDLDREEQQLEIEMDKTRHVSRKETTDELLFDAGEVGGSRSH